MRGQILDPTPLVTLVNDARSAEVAAQLTSKDVDRTRQLRVTGEASERALQLAEAAATKDKLAAEIARQKLALGWGSSLAAQTDLATLTAQLAAGERSLVRIDLPPGTPDLGKTAQIKFWSPFAAEDERLGDYLTTAPVAAPGGGASVLFTSPANQEHGGRAGASIEARLVSAKRPELLFIPASAVVRADGKTFVFRPTDNVSHPFEHVILHDLTVAITPAGEGFAVRPGSLKKGDRIVTRAAVTLLSWETLGETDESKAPEPAPSK